MAKVLAAVPKHSLESVLVAVELVLESGHPSAEHVENVINRLKPVPVQACIETDLAVTEVPLGDTSRYDRLRMEMSHAMGTALIASRSVTNSSRA